MKKVAILALIFISLSSQCKNQEIFGRSFMLTRPASYNLAMDQHLWHNIVYAKEGPTYGGFQLIPFYQDSRKRDKFGRYFLFHGKNQLLIAGDAANSTDILARDIRAEWVGLPTDFRGKLSVCPTQKQMGFTIMYNQDLRSITDIEFLQEWSIGIEVPVISVENDLNFQQCDLSTTGTEVHTQKDIFVAFNQASWKYAKIPTKSKSLTRLEKVKLTAGRAMIAKDYFELASDLFFSIPIAPHQDPAYIFSPVVGLDHHIGWGGSVFMQTVLNRDTKSFAWAFFLNLEGTFFFRNHQYRTYDLKDKPWSRYLLYTRKNSAPGDVEPGVNLLTLDSIVRPFGFADFSTGFRIYTKRFEIELGYDVWGFGGERTEPRSELNSAFNFRCEGLNEFGIAGSGTILSRGQLAQATASGSTIAERAADDSEFVGLTQNDIDTCSASAGSILNHKGHVAIGVEHMGDKMNAFGGAGAFIEYAQKNGSLSSWGAWFKIGGTF